MGARTVEAYYHVAPIELAALRARMGALPDERPGRYYVSVQRGNPAEYRLLLGPFGLHTEALAMLDPVRHKALELDPRAVWYAFGTARVPDDVTTAFGILNSHFNLPTEGTP